MRNKFFESAQANDTLYWHRLMLIMAIEIIIAFSFFGYIMVPPVAITIVTVPVLIGAFFLGPMAGLILGGVFGLTSMWKAHATATLHADIIFSPFSSGQPLDSFILAFCTRMAFGLLAGCLYVAVKKYFHGHWAAIIAATIFSLFCHSFMVLGCMELFFPEVGITAWRAVENIFALEGLINWTIFSGVLLLFSYISRLRSVRQINLQLEQIEHRYVSGDSSSFKISVFLTISLIALSLFYHFLQRTKVMLAYNNIFLTEEIFDVIYQIGLQFLVATIALVGIMVILLLYFEKYSRHMSLKAKRDALTGLYNRGATDIYIANRLVCPAEQRYILLIDIDDFKFINDHYGHPSGDKALCMVAEILSKYFPPPDIVGRLGGDEFIIYSEDAAMAANNCERIKQMMNEIREIDISGRQCVSCSIGIVAGKPGTNALQMYESADKALYIAKEKGKDNYVFL